MKKSKPFLILLLFVAVSCFIQAHATKTFVHPGIPFTRSDLDLLKANITREPWKTGYQALAADSHSKLTYGMQGPYQTVSRAPNLYNTAWQNDMVAIHNLTFMWVFTGNDAYAAKATDILDKWAATNTAWEGNENMLDIGDYISYLVPAADILKSSYSGWSADNTTHVNSYFANVLYPTSWVPAALRDNNKGALQLKIALSVAAFLDNEAKWNDAIETYRIDAGSGLRCSLPNGETGDTGRDDHWFVQAYALSWGAEVAWKQGIDMYAELNNRLHAIGELYNHYSINPSDLTFIPFGGSAAYWTTWGIAPGVRHGEPYNNLIHSAYALRKGIATPYTDQMRTLIGTENALSFLYNKSADASTATALAPIVFPVTEAVSRLTNVNIGNPGIAGNASFIDGNWLVNGAGTSVASAVNYTFKPVYGDFCIIAKVEGNTISTATAGVMLRESLSTSANNISVNLYDGSVNTKYNGTVNGYTHYPPTAPWWLKLERIGNRIFSYHSADGVNWSNHNQIISTIATDAYVGLFTLSNNTSVLNTTTFSNVSITNTAAAGAPEITSETSLTAPLATTLNYTVTASGTTTSFSASGLPAGLTIDATTGVISGTPTTIGQYVVTLGATNTNGTGIATLILNVINNTAPTAVTGLSASVVNSTKISLSWTASANATSYSVKRSLTSGGPYTTIQSGITGMTYIDASPEYEVKNYYVVTALCGDQESTPSAEVYAATAPAVPANLVASSKSNEIDLSWDVAPGASIYKIKRATVSGGPYTQVATVTSNSYADLDVTNGNSYYYVISSMGKTLESVNTTEVFGVPGSTSVTWNATPTSDVFNLATNWVENKLPANPAVISFNISARKYLTNDITELEASRVEFTSGAGGYKIGGNSLVLRNDLVNNSTAADTLTMPVVLNNQLNVYTKTSSIRLSGIVSGAGGILKRGTSALYLTGNNTYSGNTIITGTTGYKWGSTDGVIITGIGTGTSGSPLSGPFGTGKVILNGGAISSDLVTDAATIYNDIEVPAGQSGYFYERKGTMNFYGRLTGGGTIYNDGSDNYAALQLYGDNSGFTGTFISKKRSGNHRLAFMVPQAGSANANWLLDADGNDCQRLLMTSGTLRFGSLSGRGLIRNDIAGSMIISIGALNANTNYSGTISQANAANVVGVEKVGTGVQTFSGNNTYAGTTTIQSGTFLLNNNPTTGAFTSPITVNAGAFGGYGKASSSIVVGTGNGFGAAFVPGTDGAVGTFITTSSVTFNADATYKLDLNSTSVTADLIVANGVTLNNAQLSTVDVGVGSIPTGTTFIIIRNTGTSAVFGTFKNLPEQAVVVLDGGNYKISYMGGDGNDVSLTKIGDVTVVSDRESSSCIVYPNPVKDKLNISFGQGNDTDKEIRIMDTNGQVRILENIKGKVTHVLSMDNLPSGVYILMVKENDTTKMIKVIKY